MPDLTAGRMLTRLQRRSFVASLLALGAAAGAMPFCTRPTYAETEAAAQSNANGDPVQTVASFETKLLDVMKAGRNADFRQRFEMLAPAVDHTFDLETILRNSVGFQWSSMSPSERQKLLDTFRRYTIASWVASFNSWSGQQFRVSSDVKRVGDEVVVPTELVPPKGSPTNLSFVMKKEGSGWKVVDVLAEGSISRVAVQRSDFRSLLANGGVPALMASLQQKIASLSNGSLA